MKTKMKRLTSFVAAFVMTVAFLASDFSVSRVQAMTGGSGLSADISLNVFSKHLYLGEEGKNTFDFNVGKNAALEGAAYHWYIRTNKGNPDSVTINSRTGEVTAKEAGTAYIRCRITLADKTVLRPEAKVVVVNSITEVKISNISENQTIEAGKRTDFNRTVLNTRAGRSAVANGITRWEIADDTAGVGSASDHGIVIPSKAGEFSIRAVCFEDQADYRLWSMNKEAYADKITAASDWTKITVITHEGTAATLDQLSELLTADNITTITIATQEKLDIILYDGSYPDKTLIVDAPNVSIENHAYFKEIILKPANYALWLECVSGNTLTIMESNVLLYAMDTADVENVQVGTTEGPKTSEDNGKSTSNKNEVAIKSFSFWGAGTSVIIGQPVIQEPSAPVITDNNSQDTGRAIVLTNTSPTLNSGQGSGTSLSNLGLPAAGPAPIYGAGISNETGTGTSTGSGGGTSGGTGGTGTIITGGSGGAVNGGTSVIPGVGSGQALTVGGSGPTLISGGSGSMISNGTGGGLLIQTGGGLIGGAGGTITGGSGGGLIGGAGGSTIIGSSGGFSGYIQGSAISSNWGSGSFNSGSLTTGIGGTCEFYSDRPETPLVINSNSTVSLNGTGAGSFAVNLANGAAGSTITSSVPVKVMATVGATYNLGPGSEGSILAFSPTGAGSQVYNNSGQDIILAFTGSTGSSGSSVIILHYGQTANITAAGAAVNGTEKITPVINNPIKASAIYEGQSLSVSTLSGSFKNSTTNQAVAGTLTWDTPTVKVTASGAYSWTFTPTDTASYSVAKGTVTLNVISKVTPAAGIITATAISEGQALSASALYGSFKNSANNLIVEGILAWDNPAAVVSVSGNYGWTFTPTDTVHYNVAKGTTAVQVNIIKVTTVTGSAITTTVINKGQPLSASELSGSFKNPTTNQVVEGILTWKYPTTIVNSSGEYGWTFTPSDTHHYNLVEGTANVQVNIGPVTPLQGSDIFASFIMAGQPLSSSTLTAIFRDGDTGAIVEGTLTWYHTDIIAVAPDRFTWIFNPTNAIKYTAAVGLVNIPVVDPTFPEDWLTVMSNAVNMIQSANYNLVVSDASAATEGNTQEKQAAVEGVINGLQTGVEIISVVWNDKTSKYEVTIMKESKQTVTCITANFINASILNSY
jgi:hypothetical protein